MLCLTIGFLANCKNRSTLQQIDQQLSTLLNAELDNIKLASNSL